MNNAVRLHTIQLKYCTNIEIEGITIRDSLVYNIRPIACENLTIKNVMIITSMIILYLIVVRMRLWLW